MAVLGFWTRLAFALIVALLAVPTAGRAADGAVVTVTGLVDKVNRPPFDVFTDGFFAHYGVAFDKAHAFSGRDLARLGMRTIVLSYPNWSKPVTFRGPRLSAVLRAAGARGHKISVQALDGYFAEFPWAFSENDKVILAIEVDGRPLDIGGRGPAWLVFPPALQAGEGKEDDAGLVWGAFHIKIE